MAIKSCVVCGAEFDTRGNGKTCSAVCRCALRRAWECNYHASPKQRKKQREHRAKPEIRNRNCEQKREYHTRAEVRKRKREQERGYNATPERQRQQLINFHNYRARKMTLPDTLTAEQWQYALDCFDGCCAVCGRQLNDMFGEFTASADHWIPLTYEGDDNPGTVATNIVPLCHGLGGCNNRKNSTLPDEWLEREYGKRKARMIAQRIAAYFEHVQELEDESECLKSM